MQHDLSSTIALLARTPATLNALLRDLPDAWTQTNEGGDTWTARVVVGHLAHCEVVDWMPRIRRILADGESRAFDPLDRFAFEREGEGRSLSDVLDEFARLRAQNLDELRDLRLTPAQLSLRGLHPAFGSVTLAQLLAAWAAHDLTHLHQISRILAHQYRDAVGPWTRFLGVYQCAGHSAPA